MKKLTVLLLALCLLLCACGGKTTPETTPASPTEAVTATAQTEAPTTEPAPTEPQMVFEPITVVDNEEYKIEITGINPEQFDGSCYSISAKLENRSDTQKFFFMPDISINGIQFDRSSMGIPEIEAGKKGIIEYLVDNREISSVGITQCSDIAMTFHVSENSRPVEVLDTIHIYPYGKESAEVFVREPQASDLVLLDDERATIIVTGCSYIDMYKQYNVDFYIVNKTDTVLTPFLKDFYINDYAVDGYIGDIAAESTAFPSASVSQSMLDALGVTSEADIETVEFTLIVRENYGRNVLCEIPVSLTPGAAN